MHTKMYLYFTCNPNCLRIEDENKNLLLAKEQKKFPRQSSRENEELFKLSSLFKFAFTP